MRCTVGVAYVGLVSVESNLEEVGEELDGLNCLLFGYNLTCSLLLFCHFLGSLFLVKSYSRCARKPKSPDDKSVVGLPYAWLLMLSADPGAKLNGAFLIEVRSLI